MGLPAYTSSSQWYSDGLLGSHVRTLQSPGGILDLFEVARAAGDMSRPGLPEIVLHQDLIGGSRVSGDGGGGRFDVASERGGLCLAAPDLPECSPSTCA